MTTTDWDLLATLIEYPDELFADALTAARTSTRLDKTVLAAVRRFEKAIAPFSLDEMQETYVATFDFQPGCALEMGYHLYGDRHERGTFLAELRAEMHQRNVLSASELPDHLGALLRLIGRQEPDRAVPLSARIAPAVRQVKDALAAKKSPYVHLFEALCAVLTTGPSMVATT